MAIIIRTKGNPSVKVEKSMYSLEKKIQEYIENNPEIIPIYDIDPSLKLMILKREFITKSGPIDVLAVDNTGSLYIIETKLFKNPDKRLVIAQVLDYGAMLSDSYRDFSDFLSNITFDLLKGLKTTFQLTESDAQNVFDVIKSNLFDENFKFMILMDQLEERLKKLILYLNRKSDFDIFAVEIENYQWKGNEIVIPRLFGVNIRKDFSAQTARKPIPTDDEILSNYANTDISEEITQFFKLYKEAEEGKIPFLTGDKTTQYVNIRVTPEIYVNLHVSPMSENKRISFWVVTKDKTLALKTVEVLKKGKNITIVNPKNPDSWQKIAYMDIMNFNYEEMLQILKEVSEKLSVC